MQLQVTSVLHTRTLATLAAAIRGHALSFQHYFLLSLGRYCARRASSAFVKELGHVVGSLQLGTTIQQLPTQNAALAQLKVECNTTGLRKCAMHSSSCAPARGAQIGSDRTFLLRTGFSWESVSTENRAFFVVPRCSAKMACADALELEQLYGGTAVNSNFPYCST